MFNRNSNQLNKMKNLKLKPSRFNVLVNKENYLKLYNSYTGKIATNKSSLEIEGVIVSPTT